MGMTFEMCAKLEAEGSSSKAISGSAEATVSVALDISTSVNANLLAQTSVCILPSPLNVQKVSRGQNQL
ncbi:hypothetical protein BASA61_002530 [Batrachochytrium salamandrivorans]|nr:hypothetical protein BASA61_002530 [Batrachochytrium salamandrivorans]